MAMVGIIANTRQLHIATTLTPGSLEWQTYGKTVTESSTDPPTHRPCHRLYPLPTHRLLTNDPRAVPPAAPTQRRSTLDPVF